jgi:hypothetical protein
LHDLFIYIEEDYSRPMTSIDDNLTDAGREKPNDIGLYVLGGVAMFVSLVWVFSFWWV